MKPLALVVGFVLFSLLMGCANQGAGGKTTPAKVDQPAAEPIFIPSPAAEIPVADYAIGPGDVLDISVWKDEALSRRVVVLPDGTISFPLVGQFMTSGKSVAQLKEEMEQQISRYVPEPEMNIILQQVNSMVVYVIGKVNHPGHITLNRNISVLQALAMAGGLNVFANPQEIQIVRKSEDGTLVIPFNYKAVIEQNMMIDNIVLERGDVVVVK